jgi:hypothetical protein
VQARAAAVGYAWYVLLCSWLRALGLEQEKVSLECDLLARDMPEPLSHQAVETPPGCGISDLRNKAVERWETLSPARVSGLL